MAKKKNKVTNPLLRKFSLVLWIVSILFMIILGYFIYSANILPVKYFLMIVILFVILMSIHGIFILNRKTRTWLLIVLNIIAFVFMAGESFAILKINDTLSFLKNNLGARFETNIYNIVVNANSSYNSLEDIQNTTIKIAKDMDDMKPVEDALKKKADTNYEYDENVVDLLTNVAEDTKLVILVNSGNYDAMVQNDETFEAKVRVIDTVSIVTEREETDTNIDVTKDPFVVYLSGIDTRSNSLPSRSLSDVNII